ncbi:MAG TPA: SPFH domain-containing protein [Candidatus Acidoferrales bacterium]
MNTDNIWPALFLVGLVILIWSRRLGKTPRVFIPDYKRGVRFSRGAFVDVLGPGTHHPFTLKQQIEVVDMRPQPIFLDRVSYRDVLQNESFMSIGAEVLVGDARLAVNMLKDQIKDSLPLVRHAVQSLVSRGIADDSAEYRIKTSEDITRIVNDELARVGMKIANVEIVELWSRPGLERNTTVSN